MAQRTIILDPQTLLRLLTHYTEGKAVPLVSECVGVKVSRIFSRLVSLSVSSPEWATADLATPMWVGYEGRKTHAWSEKGAPVVWTAANEDPKRQC